MLRIKNNYMEDQRLLASVALFRKLYDNKKDAYDVLAEFLRASININRLWTFTVEECSAHLTLSFGFRIPSAVLKSCLRRRLKDEVILSHGIYTATEKFQKSENLQSEIAFAQIEQEQTIQKLVDFVADLVGSKLSLVDDEKLRDDFHKFFLGGLSPGKNHVYISQFILKNSNDIVFTEKLNHLEEGLILYQGIGYSASTGPTNSWRASFTIYLDTELLFWAAGYDGALFEKIFKEFIDLVREMNLKTSGDVKLAVKYFPETKREVDSLFGAAEHIVAGGSLLDPSRTAMQHILKGCGTRSDVVTKKGNFFASLAKFKIHEEVERNYYEPAIFNCESIDILERLASEYSEIAPEKIANCLKFFTKINYLRRGISNTGLEQSVAILVSGKKLSRNLAFHPSILQAESAIPFSTDLEYLTERLWFKLGKGFGGDAKTPAAFDVVARAQLIISTQISSKVSNDFRSLISKVGTGEMSINEASYIVSELKSRSVKPEELNAENIEGVSEYLDIDSIEAGVRNIRLLEGKAEELEVKNKIIEEANKKISDYERKTFEQDFRAWKLKMDEFKKNARRNYKAIAFVISFAPIFILASIAFALSVAADTLLSKIGFILTAAAFLWAFVSTRYIHKSILRIVQVSLKKIRGFTARPKLGS